MSTQKNTKKNIKTLQINKELNYDTFNNKTNVRST